MTPKTHYTCAELAALKLPGLPGSEPGVRTRVMAENWAWREVPCKGGKGGMRREYQPPKAVRDLILSRSLSQIMTSQAALPVAAAPAAPAPAPKKRKLPTPPRAVKPEADLTDANRAYQDAALVLCRAIEDACCQADCSEKKSIGELAARIVEGSARIELVAAADTTYLKKRPGGQTVAALTSRLQKMMRFYRDGRDAGDAGMYLVAKNREPEGYDPIHIRAFLIHFCHPNRPPTMEAWRASESWFATHGLPRPAVDTFYRIEKSLPVTIKYHGRMTGGQWRALLPYVARDVSMFHANDIWVGDGHSFKAKVQHPIHGQPFTPEVTLIIDWVSRKVVGWSVDLAESTIAVSAAFRHSQMQTRAKPLVYYSDNGSGQTGKTIDCQIHGTLARQGIAHETGIPGNAQGRGIIERIWQVTLIPLARTYPTCTWRGSDKENTRKMLVSLNKKDGSGERLLPAWSQFLLDIEQCVNDYNTTHEHSELNGNTPESEYAARIDPNSIFFGANDNEISLQWMPEVARTPQRGLVSLFGNEYANKELVHLLAEGEKVRVRFDIHNADRVWLLRMDGRFIGTAEWDGHKRAAFPVPFIEQKREDRAEGKIKRGERIIAEARAELGNTIEGQAVPVVELPPMQSLRDLLEIVPVGEREEEKSLKDVMPEEPEGEETAELSYLETVMWLQDGKSGENPHKEVAAR